MEGLSHGSKGWILKAEHFVSLKIGVTQSRGHDGTKVFWEEG